MHTLFREQSFQAEEPAQKFRLRLYRRPDAFLRVELSVWVPYLCVCGEDESYWRELEAAEVVASVELAEREAALFVEKHRWEHPRKALRESLP